MKPPRQEPPRVLLIDDDPLTLKVVGDLLYQAGYAVQLLQYPTLAVATAKSFAPEVAIVDLHMPVLSGLEVARALLAFEETASVPVIFFSATRSPRDDLRALFAGAVDVWGKPLGHGNLSRLAAVLNGNRPQPGTPRCAQVRRSLLRLYETEQTTGTLLLNPRTPFEGRAVFVEGGFRSARYGPLAGIDALDEMMAQDDGIWRFEPNAQEQLPPSALPPAGYAARLLLVDDDPDLRRLTSLQLQRQGYAVEVAEHGEEGWRKARAGEFDVVVADLNMPVLDGWGLLKLLKADVRTRETPVLVLSAHDDYRETLKAARAGAHDYLRKTGHAAELARRVAALVRARVEAWSALRDGAGLEEIEVSVLGPSWLLRAIAELDASVHLQGQDDFGAYDVVVKSGALVEASARAGARQAIGAVALSAFLVSRGARASITMLEAREPPAEAPLLHEVLAAAIELVSGLESRANEQALEGGFTLDAELFALFQRVGSDREVALARALGEAQRPVAELAAALGLPLDEAQAGLRELLRRGVLRAKEGA